MRRAPRHPVHRGSVEAAGAFLASGGGGGEASLRERALSLWSPGAEVHRLSSGLVVLFPSPRRVLTRASLGAPLVRQGTLLCSAPLAPDELEALGAPPESAVLVLGGEASAHPLGAATLEDPARWLELSAFAGAPVQGLGRTPPPVPEALRPIDLSLRERLAGPGASPEAEEAAVALRGVMDARPAGPERGLRAFAGRLLRRLARLVSGGGRSAGTPARRAEPGPGGTLARSPALDLPPARPSWRTRLADWLNRAAARAALVSGLARVLGARQAEYFNRMMRFFEEGDLEQALRHAIPLGDGTATSPALGVPRPRDDLRIPLGPKVPGAGIGVGAGLMKELRDLYRRTFQRLERAGEIERAAFVLAELLGASEEAVAFLERHGQLSLAAALAESRGLPPGLVVRQWFLAGDTERALLVARRTGAFADALVRLQRSHPDRADAFSLQWADALAEGGDYLRAAEVAWGIPGAMALIVTWLDRAIDVGGPTGARALVLRVSVDADAFGALQPRALAVLQAPLSEDAGSRRAFADELESLRRLSPQGLLSAPLAALARASVRALARDAGEGANWVGRRQLEALARMAGEPALEADLPPLAPVRPVNDRVLAHRAGAPGQRRVHDVALLPGGRLLVAHGESGAELCTRDGRRVYLFDVPAHSVVVSDHGDRAIAVAPRGDQKLLSRLDLRTGKAARWCEAPLRAFAKDYDGDLWFASEPGALLAVDARAPELRAVWRLPQLPGGVLGISRAPRHCHFLVQPEWNAERWSLELPSFTLRARTEVLPGPEGSVFISTVGPDGVVVCADYLGLVPGLGSLNGAVTQSLRLFQGAADQRSVEIGPSATTWPPTAGAGLAAAVSPTPAGLVVTVVDTAKLAIAARLELPGARLAAIRFSGERAAVGDDAGRVVVLDLGRRCVTHELRR